MTYRHGHALAAYLTLAHPTGQKVSRTEATVDGLLFVDFASNGLPIGIEITAPGAVPPARLNQALMELGEPPMAQRDYGPLRPV